MEEVRFVPLSQSQAYLERTWGLRPFTDRHFRHLIRIGKAPKPLQVSPGRKAHTNRQLDAYARALLAQAGEASDAAD